MNAMNAPVPVEQAYAEVLSKSAEVEASDKLYPVTRTGFFKLVSATGKDLGLAFYCPKCRMAACGLDESSFVFHCGKESYVPTGWLAKRLLPKFTLRRNWF